MNDKISDCIFCSIPKDRIILENELIYAIRDNYPVTPLHSLIIPKRHINKKTKKKLSISEIFYSNVSASLKSEEYDFNNIELEESEPEEIRDLVIEMDERLKGSWKEDSEDLLLQKNSWKIFENSRNTLAV